MYASLVVAVFYFYYFAIALLIKLAYKLTLSCIMMWFIFEYHTDIKYLHLLLNKTTTTASR